MYDPAENMNGAGDTAGADDAAVSVLDPGELLASIDVSRANEVINPTEIRLQALTELARTQAAVISVAQAAMVRTVAAMIASKQAMSGCTMIEFVAAKCGLQRGEAIRLVRLAEELVEFPKVAQAFHDGQISEATCDLIVRKAEPEIEDDVLFTAGNATGPQLARLLSDYQGAKAKNQPEDTAPPEPEPSRFAHGWIDGRYRLNANLDHQDGELVDVALTAARDRLHADRTAADPDHPDIEPEGTHTITALDVLEELAHTSVDASTTTDGLLPERLMTVMHLNAELFESGQPTANGLYLQESGAIDGALADQYLCGTTIRGYICDRNLPLWETKPVRTATPSQRRALQIRDRCCRYPGCGTSRRLIPHHIVPHALTGPTALDNLVLLCGRHHKAIHTRGLTNWLDDTYRYHVRDPRGAPITTPRPPAGPPPQPDPHKQRLRGYGETLTFYARDGIVGNWLVALRNNRPPALPPPESYSAGRHVLVE